MPTSNAATVSANAIIANYLEKLEAHVAAQPTQSITREQLQQFIQKLPHCSQHTFTRNDITITYPKGYRSIHAFLDYLKSTNITSHKFAENQQTIGKIELALA